jgi:hypothetical protein
MAAAAPKKEEKQEEKKEEKKDEKAAEDFLNMVKKIIEEARKGNKQDLENALEKIEKMVADKMGDGFDAADARQFIKDMLAEKDGEKQLAKFMKEELGVVKVNGFFSAIVGHDIAHLTMGGWDSLAGGLSLLLKAGALGAGGFYGGREAGLWGGE